MSNRRSLFTYLILFCLLSLLANCDGKQGTTIASLEQEGLNQIAQKNYAGAIPYYENIREIDPQYKPVLSTLLGLYVKTRQYPKAIEICKELLKNEPNYDIYLALGLIYDALGQTEQASQNFQKGYTAISLLLEKNPSNINYRLTSGILLYLLDKPEQAMRQFQYIQKAKHVPQLDKELWQAMHEELKRDIKIRKCLFFEYCDPPK